MNKYTLFNPRHPRFSQNRDPKPIQNRDKSNPGPQSVLSCARRDTIMSEQSFSVIVNNIYYVRANLLGKHLGITGPLVENINHLPEADESSA